MSYIIPDLRTQRQIYEGTAGRLRDDQSRWSDEEVYRALNDAMSEWSERVFIPYIYTITGGFTAQQSVYSIPSYISKEIQPQRLISRWWESSDEVGEDTTEFIWVDVHAWNLEPDGAGGQNLRVEISNNRFSNSDARILWWGTNGGVPEEIQALNASISASDTALVIADRPQIPKTGYIKIDDEWILYSGISISGTTTSLTNLIRGVDGAAAAHSEGVEVFWGVAAPKTSLWNQLNSQMRASLHELLMTSSSVEETQQHQWQMRWHSQKADNFWASYAANRPMRIKLSRQGTGGTLI